MRTKTYMTAALMIPAIVFGQSGEFPTDTNGLMYSSATMAKLSYIVDSLNLKFKTCDLYKTYYAKFQTRAHYIFLDTGDIKRAKADLQSNMSFEEFIKKYPSTEIEKDQLLVKHRYENYENEDIISYNTMPFSSGYGLSIEVEGSDKEYARDLTNRWIINYDAKTDYSKESISAFYVTTAFESKPLAEQHARLVQYVDCMVDTSAVIYRKEATYGHVEIPKNYESMTLNKKKKLLEECRSTKVIGGCSMDQSPRIHARNIAILSADAVQWDIFLRAHLDIMNDRFERMSDGSYAWAGRQTYIRELEQLEINVTDLMLGISLRVENANPNHYYGSIGRLGRALSESAHADEVEIRMLSLISDSSLDDYNRMIIYYLYLNYVHYLEDETRKNESKIKLKQAIQTLPEYIASRIEIK